MELENEFAINIIIITVMKVNKCIAYSAVKMERRNKKKHTHTNEALGKTERNRLSRND